MTSTISVPSMPRYCSRKPVRMLVLLILAGIIGSVNASLVVDERPKYPLDASFGCKPGALTTAACPARMECFHDKNYLNGGRCDCNPLWFKIPAKLPFDSKEFDDGFSSDDCESVVITTLIVGLGHLASVIISASFVYTSIILIRDLAHGHSLKRSALNMSLFVLTYAAFSSLLVSLIYLLK